MARQVSFVNILCVETNLIDQGDVLPFHPFFAKFLTPLPKDKVRLREGFVPLFAIEYMSRTLAKVCIYTIPSHTRKLTISSSTSHKLVAAIARLSKKLKLNLSNTVKNGMDQYGKRLIGIKSENCSFKNYLRLGRRKLSL